MLFCYVGCCREESGDEQVSEVDILGDNSSDRSLGKPEISTDVDEVKPNDKMYAVYYVYYLLKYLNWIKL